MPLLGLLRPGSGVLSKAQAQKHRAVTRIAVTDTSFFGRNYLATTAVPHAFRVLAKLVEKRFGERLHLVSKCGPAVKEKTLKWLAHHKFHEQTGVPAANLHFCLERHEKADICGRLKVTHFIDDRLEVLGYLAGLVPHLYLFSPKIEETAKFSKYRSKVRVMNNWLEIEQALLRKSGRFQ